MKTYVVKVYEVEKTTLDPKTEESEVVRAFTLLLDPQNGKRVEPVYSQVVQSENGEVIKKIVSAVNS